MEAERSRLASRLSINRARGQATGPNDQQRQTDSSVQQTRLNSIAFWLLGLLNNSAYVIMIAGANEISSGAVGLTYLCAILPALLVKATGPYWFHVLSYSVRSWLIAILMMLSYTTVAFSSTLGPQLLGVALGALQGGLGEASCLAMASFYDSKRVITFWSSGTGFAGVFGYSWVALLHIILGFSFTTTLLLANLSCVAWLATYYLVLDRPEKVCSPQQLIRTSSEIPQPDGDAASLLQDTAQESQGLPLLENSVALSSTEMLTSDAPTKASRAKLMSFKERWERTLALWPYIAPLALVYFAEYSMQAGTWTAIGFPVHERKQREAFYSFSNWTYQLGVFLSRSSGLAFQADIKALWAMPVMQIALLIFFILDAWLHFWYNYWLLLPCLITGLLGGAVYVNAFTLISRDIDPKYREFSLSAASLGDSLGIAFADITGILMQGCLFRLNGLPGAYFSC